MLAFAVVASAQNDEENVLSRPKARAPAAQKFGPAPRTAGSFEAPYRTPAGSGAGDTGFVSQKKSAKKKAKKKAAPVPNPAARNPALLRAQATQPDVTGATPLRLRRPRPVEDDPYGPIGFRAGTFVIRPSVELQSGYDSNADRAAGGAGSKFNAINTQILAKSEWLRHEASLDLRGGYTAYSDVDGADRPELQSILRGRIDVTALSRIEVDGKFAITTENPGSPDAIASVKRQPSVYTFGANVAYVRQFNRFEVTTGAGIERNLYDNADLTNGGTLSLADRDYIAYSLRLRGAYEWSPEVKPFVEALIDKRERDLPVGFDGLRRDSNGNTLRAGLTFGRKERLSGEISAGFANRSYADPLLNDISGFIFDSSLVWRATGLTTVTLQASSGIDETQVVGAAGVLRREAKLIVDHAFRRWLVGTVSVGWSNEEYRGAGLVNDYLRSSVALTYWLNRSVALKGEFRNERLFSNVPGQDYTANIGLIGLRLQR